MSHIFRKIHNPDWITQVETLQYSLAEQWADGLETITSDLWRVGWFVCTQSKWLGGAEAVDTFTEILAPYLSPHLIPALNCTDKLHSSPTVICFLGDNSWNSQREGFQISGN